MLKYFIVTSIQLKDNKQEGIETGPINVITFYYRFLLKYIHWEIL